MVEPGVANPITDDRLRNVPKQARAQRSVAAVLDSAAEILVAEPGLLTMSEIGRRSGVSKGTVYRYFDDVAAIVQTLAVPYVEAAIARVEAVLVSPPDVASAAILVNQLLDEVLAYVDADPVARAIFVTAYNRLYVGELYDYGVDRLASHAISALSPIMTGDESIRKPVALLGVHMTRSLLDLTVGSDPDEVMELMNAYRLMMIRAAAVDQGLPSAVDVAEISDGHVDLT